MKRAKILGAVLILVGGACGEPEEAAEIAPIGEPAATVAVPVPAALPAPVHGGTVLMAGQRAIEVVADRAGAFNAYHLGAPPAAPQDARVTVRVPDAEGQTRPVLLTWNPNESRYTGLLRGAQPVAGPLELVYVLGGETARATAPTFVLIEPVVQAATALVGTPGAVTPVVVERPSARNIVVQAPSAPPPPQIVVQAPTPSPPPHIVVQAPTPPPPPQIVVQAPPPPQVIVRPPAPPPPPRVVVQAPPPPRVVVATPQPPPPPRVVVQPPPPPRVVVRPPAPPPPPRVVVRAPEPPQPRVVVQPAPPPRVVVRPGRGERDEREERRGHGHGDRNHRHTGPGGRGR